MTMILNSQPVDTIIIFAGPGGLAFNKIHISNLKTVMETHGKTVFVVGDGERDLYDTDIEESKRLLSEQYAAEKKCLFLVYTHGEIHQHKHTLKFSSSVSYSSRNFIEQITEINLDNPIDFFIFSCHGRALLNELENKTTHGNIITLSPAQDMVSGLAINAFIRSLRDIGQKGILFHTLEDFLTLYLAALASRTSPYILTKNDYAVQLIEYFSAEQAAEIVPFINHFFNPELVQETLHTAQLGARMPYKFYPCSVFFDAVIKGLISIENSNRLWLSESDYQETFFQRYLTEDDSSASVSSIYKKTIQLGTLPQENMDNCFETFRPTEKTNRLFTATSNFSRALFSKKEQDNLLLILTGSTGIGKTHLAIAALNNAREKGMKTYYVEYQAFYDLSGHEKNAFQQTIIKNPGLLVMDDFNFMADCETINFIKKIHELSRTSILITSNASLDRIRSELPIGDNIVVCEGNKDITQRNPWWVNKPLSSLSAACMPEEKSCGILLVRESIDLEQIKADLIAERHNLSLPPLNIRVAGNPLHGQCYNVAEMGFTFKENDHLDMLIIKVTTIEECEQLLEVIGSAWELNRKIVVVCEDEALFEKLYISQLSFETEKERLDGRLKCMLLTPRILATLPDIAMNPEKIPDQATMSASDLLSRPVVRFDAEKYTSLDTIPTSKLNHEASKNILFRINPVLPNVFSSSLTIRGYIKPIDSNSSKNLEISTQQTIQSLFNLTCKLTLSGFSKISIEMPSDTPISDITKCATLLKNAGINVKIKHENTLSFINFPAELKIKNETLTSFNSKITALEELTKMSSEKTGMSLNAGPTIDEID